MLQGQNRLSVRLILAALVPAIGASACGPVDEESGEDVSETVGAVVAGMTNVTNNRVPNSTFQSETATVPIGTGFATAYNTDDSAHGKVSDHYCRQYSEQSITFRLSSALQWRTKRVPTAPGMALFNGDPALVIDNHFAQNYRLYVSSLAVSDTVWNTLGKRADGCIDPTTREKATVDSACVTAVDIPRDGVSASSLPFSTCLPAGTDVLDGGDLDLSAANNLYAAYWNYTRKRIDVYQARLFNFARLPTPFPNKTMVGHPIFVRSSDTPYLIAPDSGGRFWVAALNETTLTWSAPVQVASGFVWQDEIRLRNGASFRQIGYSAQWISGFAGSPVLLFVYQLPRSASGFTQLQGVLCSTVPTLGCQTPPGLRTSAFENALLPAVAVAHKFTGVPLALPYLSYWTDRGSMAGTLALRMDFVDWTIPAFVTKLTGSAQTPCPVVGFGYWGDYDHMIVQEDNTANALLVRTGTDSTGAACTATGDPQHVSILTMAP